ncbi:hypothetical protein CBS101457_005246 [Exobasidium rhododendri]|nr:hypothetical protein CBS101457_005246 [Exobasidium rhododendri]
MLNADGESLRPDRIDHSTTDKRQQQQQENVKVVSSAHLTASGAASLASASSITPTLLSRPILKSSASRAQGQVPQTSSSASADLGESTRLLRLSPSPGRSRSLLSLSNEDVFGDKSFEGSAVEEGGGGGGEQEEKTRGTETSDSPIKDVRSALLTRRLRSAIGEDITLQQELIKQVSSTEEGVDATPALPRLEGESKDHVRDHSPVTSERSSENEVAAGWGWSTFTTLPSSLRMEGALNSLRGSSVAGPSKIVYNPSTNAKSLDTQSTSVKNGNEQSEHSFGSYMKPLDVRRWWAGPSVSSSSGSASRERPVNSSRSRSLRGSDDDQSTKSAESSKVALEDPLKGLSPGSFPASSLARRGKKKREKLPKLKEREDHVSKSTIVAAKKVKDATSQQESDVVEHDLTNHPFGVDGEKEKFPQREYLVLSTAGKPIYVSYVSKARLHRAAETRARREEARLNLPKAVGEDEEAEEALAAEDRSLQDDEDQKSATKVGVLQALISNYESLGMKELQQRSLDLLEFPKGTRICYYLKPPLYLVAISQWGEEDSTLRNHLEHLYLAIISLVTASKLSRLFDRAANFDLKRLLDGTDGILDTLLTNLQTDATSLFGSLQPLRIDSALRLDIGSALIPSKETVRPQDALYALLLSHSGIVTLARRKNKSIHPIDCHLLINTVYSTKAMKDVGTQSWVPICLPKFASQGFLYAHVSFLGREEDEAEEEEGVDLAGKEEEEVAAVEKDERDGDTKKEANGQPPQQTRRRRQRQEQKVADLALVLVTSNPDGFEEMSQWRNAIIYNLTSQGLLAKLSKTINNVETMAMATSTYSADELRLPGLRHFIFKWRSNVQSTSPQFEDPYTINSDNHKRLVCLYGMAFHYIHTRASNYEEEEEEKEEEDGKRKEEQEQRSSKFKNTDEQNTSTAMGTKPSPPNAAPSSPIIRPKSVLAPSIEAASSGSGSAATHNTPASTNTITKKKKKKTLSTGQHLIRTPYENVFAWSTQPFEVYLTVSPHLPQTAIVNIAKSIVKWVKQEEHRLFIVSAPVF